MVMERGSNKVMSNHYLAKAALVVKQDSRTLLENVPIESSEALTAIGMDHVSNISLHLG